MRRILLGVVLLTACSIDLVLPPPPVPVGVVPPTLESFTPLEGHAGVLVALKGSSFAADAAANVVAFPGRTARGEGFTKEGALLVRVPDDAGSGALVVETSGGRSTPVEGFTYLGLGRPRYGRVTAEHRISIDPRQIAASGSRVALLSRLFGSALVGGGGAPVSITTPGAWRVAPAARGAFFVVTLEPRLLVVRADEEPGASIALDTAPDFLLANTDRLVTIADDFETETTTVEYRNPETLGLIARHELKTIGWFETADLLADGTIVGLAVRLDDEASGIGRVAPDGTETFLAQSALDDTRLGAVIDSNTMLAFVETTTPVLVDLDDGATSEPLEDFTGGNVSDVVGVPSAGVAVAARCERSEVAAWSADGRLEWAYRGLPCPTHLAADDASGRIFVADAQRNEVQVLDARTGAVLGIVGFSLGIGGRVKTGLARAGETLYVPALGSRVLSVPLDTWSPSDLLTNHPADEVVSDGASTWGFSLDDETGFHRDADGTVTDFVLQGPIVSARPYDGGLLVAVPGEVYRLRGGTIDATRAWTGISADRIVNFVEPLPSGAVLVSARTPAGDHVEAWSAEELFTPDTTGATILSPSERDFNVRALIPREGRVYASIEASIVASVIGFDTSWAQVSRSWSAIRQANFARGGPGAQSVVWSEGAGRLHFGRFTAAGSIAEDGTLDLGGVTRGLTWSASGERLFVTVEGRDSIFEIE